MRGGGGGEGGGGTEGRVRAGKGSDSNSIENRRI